ncbi:MAG: hypothetical protein ABJA93_06995 [Sporichthyaceae bacterium]
MTDGPVGTPGPSWSMALIRVGPDSADLAGLLRDNGVPSSLPVVVLVGGASGLAEAESARCDRLIRSCVIPVVERLGACLVDGGTDSGIIALAGLARRDARALAPHVGVVAAGTVRLPGEVDDGRIGLEPHHSHVVVVPGDDWGDEVPWLAAVATVVAGDRPSVTVLANGGDVAYDDVRHSLAAGRPVLVLSGTGRAADAIAAAQAGSPADERAKEVAASPLVTSVAFDVDAVTAAIDLALRRRLA